MFFNRVNVLSLSIFSEFWIILITIGFSSLYRYPDNANTFDKVPVFPKNLPCNSEFVNLLAKVPLTPIIDSEDWKVLKFFEYFILFKNSDINLVVTRLFLERPLASEKVELSTFNPLFFNQNFNLI